MDEKNTLKVLFVASEAFPFAKVGGLADIATSLSKALRRLDVDIRLLIPLYGHMRDQGPDVRRIGEGISVPMGPDQELAHLLETRVDGVPIYMIWDDKYFSTRKKVYGFNDDPQRFAFFSRAVISALPVLDWKPDVIHANDWPAAPMVAWLNLYGRQDPFYRDIAVLYTIHKLSYQGLCGRLILTFAQMDKLAHLPIEPPGQVNWMAQGIANADLINTVSPTYAQEILTPEAGMGMDSLLKERQDRFFGILSGIDREFWDPEHDNALTQPFDLDSLSMRRVNKMALQREIKLETHADVPVLGMISRLDRTKGLDILLPVLDRLLQERALQFVLLGEGSAEYEAQFRDLQARFPDQVRTFIKFDERLARRIYAGADLFVTPSYLESSGLTHMIAMRYGVIPIVRATGALRDTVVDVDADPKHGTGFVFQPYTTDDLEATLRRALAAYRDGSRWRGIQERAMQMDFSWDSSARAYIELYQRALALH